MKVINYYKFNWIKHFDNGQLISSEIDEKSIEKVGEVGVNPEYIIKIQRVGKSSLFLIVVDELDSKGSYWTNVNGFDTLTKEITQ